MNDAITDAAVQLTETLRVWLRARRQPNEVLAAAMAYEVAALIANDSTTEAQAFRLIDAWAASMKDQIRVYGVHREHP